MEVVIGRPALRMPSEVRAWLAAVQLECSGIGNMAGLKQWGRACSIASQAAHAKACHWGTSAMDAQEACPMLLSVTLCPMSIPPAGASPHWVAAAVATMPAATARAAGGRRAQCHRGADAARCTSGWAGALAPSG